MSRACDLAGATRGALLLSTLALFGCGEGYREVPVRAWDLVVAGGPGAAVTLPAQLDGRMEKHPQTYHLRADVELPVDLHGVPLTLVLPHLWADAELSVAGSRMEAEGPLPDATYRPRGEHAFVLPSEATRSGRLSLDLAVRHTWTQSAWIDPPPYLTSAPRGGLRLAVVRAIALYGNLLAVGSVLTVGFVYGVLFLIERRRWADGWLAVQASSAAPYCLFGTGLTAYAFGDWDGSAVLLALVLAIYGSVQFTHNQFHLPPPSRAWTGLLIAAAVTTAGWGGPFHATQVVAPMAVSAIVLGVVYQIVVVARLALGQNAPLNASVVLAAWVVLGLVAANDLAAWVGLGEHLRGARVGGIGVACFGLLQSFALSRDFIRSLRATDRLNEELKGQVDHLAEKTATVAHLNDELRRQVLARSEQLSDALTRLASAQGEAVVLRENDVVEGRYAVVRVIGSGGMGVVYEVRRTGDGARLALKVLSGTVGVRELARFAREARLAAAIHHPNVVQIFDVAVSTAGFLFLVLEFVDGQSLHRRREQIPNVAWTLGVLLGIAQGLEAVHARGIVHRDLKPANILLREDASGVPVEIKITDFGISNLAAVSGQPEPTASSLAARIAGSTFAPLASAAPDRLAEGSLDPPTRDWAPDPPSIATSPTGGSSSPRGSSSGPLTQTGTMLGTPAYMAPEVVRDARSAGTPSDVYSFGVIAFELLHGRRPFTEPEAMARAFGFLDAELPPLEGTGMAAISALLDAALAIEPARRPTAAVLVGALSTALAEVAVRATRTTSPPPAARRTAR